MTRKSNPRTFTGSIKSAGSFTPENSGIFSDGSGSQKMDSVPIKVAKAAEKAADMKTLRYSTHTPMKKYISY